MTIYSLSTVDELINHYEKNSGNIDEKEEGCLGYGTLVLSAPGLKTAIVREVYLNEWSSGHSIRFYNKTPAKYV